MVIVKIRSRPIVWCYIFAKMLTVLHCSIVFGSVSSFVTWWFECHRVTCTFGWDWDFDGWPWKNGVLERYEKIHLDSRWGQLQKLFNDWILVVGESWCFPRFTDGIRHTMFRNLNAIGTWWLQAGSSSLLIIKTYSFCLLPRIRFLKSNEKEKSSSCQSSLSRSITNDGRKREHLNCKPCFVVCCIGQLHCRMTRIFLSQLMPASVEIGMKIAIKKEKKASNRNEFSTIHSAP